MGLQESVDCNGRRKTNGRTLAIIGNHQISWVAIKARFKMKGKKIVSELKRSRGAKFRGLYVLFVWMLTS